MKKGSSFLLSVMLTIVTYGQEIPVPPPFIVLDTVSGDLDNDGIAELVVAYNAGPESESYESIPRELIIYKMKGTSWVPWKQSGQALYGSRDGGMMGDPFDDMEIKNGILLITQNGGSSWKWGHTDKYRYQDGECYLIGYTSVAGKLCEYWREVDFNLSTGKMTVRKDYESCENGEQDIYKKEHETLYKKGLKITLQGRNEKEIKIITPKFRHEIYIAVGNDH